MTYPLAPGIASGIVQCCCDSAKSSCVCLGELLHPFYPSARFKWVVCESQWHIVPVNLSIELQRGA